MCRATACSSLEGEGEDEGEGEGAGEEEGEGEGGGEGKGEGEGEVRVRVRLRIMATAGIGVVLFPCRCCEVGDEHTLLPALQPTLLGPCDPALEVSLALEVGIHLRAEPVLERCPDAVINVHELARCVGGQQVAVRLGLPLECTKVLGRCLAGEVVKEDDAPLARRTRLRRRLGNLFASHFFTEHVVSPRLLLKAHMHVRMPRRSLLRQDPLALPTEPAKVRV